MHTYKLSQVKNLILTCTPFCMSTLTGDLTQLSVTEPTTTTITIQTAQRHKESVDSISYEITVSGGYTTDSSLVHRQVAGAVTAQRRRQTVNT